MLEEDRGIVAAQRGAQQADRVLGVGRHRELPADGVQRTATSLHWLCQGSPHLEKPPGMRTTIGAAKRLAVRQRIVPQSFSCSAAGSAYLRNWISGTGMRPASAMPTARPMMPSSDRLVSNTRSSPNCSCRPERRGVHAALAADVFAEHQHARVDRSSCSSVRRIAVSMLMRAPSGSRLALPREPASRRPRAWPPCGCSSRLPSARPSRVNTWRATVVAVDRGARFDPCERRLRPRCAPRASSASHSASRNLRRHQQRAQRQQWIARALACDLLGGLVGLGVLAGVAGEPRHAQAQQRGACRRARTARTACVDQRRGLRPVACRRRRRSAGCRRPRGSRRCRRPASAALPAPRCRSRCPR